MQHLFYSIFTRAVQLSQLSRNRASRTTANPSAMSRNPLDLPLGAMVDQAQRRKNNRRNTPNNRSQQQYDNRSSNRSYQQPRNRSNRNTRSFTTSTARNRAPFQSARNPLSRSSNRPQQPSVRQRPQVTGINPNELLDYALDDIPGAQNRRNQNQNGYNSNPRNARKRSRPGDNRGENYGMSNNRYGTPGKRRRQNWQGQGTRNTRRQFDRKGRERPQSWVLFNDRRRERLNRNLPVPDPPAEGYYLKGDISFPHTP